jgi:putative aminopeptidase FrvX
MSEIPELLSELLKARSPSGNEKEAQDVLKKYISQSCDEFIEDSMGNVFATLNVSASPSLMLAGHIDELGFIIRYIDDKGFLYFDTIGGHDKSMISGRRVDIMTKDGVIRGVTGKRAIHLMSEAERKKVPELHQMWIDIGVSSKEEAEELVRVGDTAVYSHSVEIMRGSVVNSRAIDDKSGAYAVMEVIRRLSGNRDLQAKLTCVATTQEEIGVRGATVATHSLNPDVAIAVDVGHATDHPDCNKRKHGDYKLGGGPIITRGPNVHPQVFDRLEEVCANRKIPFQYEADARPISADARAMQVARGGVATGMISIPLRYMHTASEVVDLQDIEWTVQLLEGFALSLQPGDFQFGKPV